VTPLEKRLTAWVDAAKAGDAGAVDLLHAEIDRLAAQVDRVSADWERQGATITRLTKDNVYLNRMLTERSDGVRVRVVALLDACHAAGRTWLPTADIRKALDMEE